MFRVSIRRLIIATLLAGFLVTSGCEKSDQRPATKVHLSTSKNVWCSLPLLADAHGFFKSEGLDVHLTFTDGGRYCMDAVLSGSADAGTVVETNVSYLGFTGNDTILVVGNVVESTSVAIVARRSSGIRELSDLEGRKLGYAPAMQGEIYANRVLAKHGVDISKVHIQKLQPKAIPSALDSGAIDAASTWEPFVYACTRALGDDAVVFRDADAHKGYMHLAVRRKWAEEHHDTVVALLRALRRAEEFAAGDPAQAMKTLARIMHVDVELVKAIWPYFEIRLTLDVREVTEAITAEGEWIRSSQEKFIGKQLPKYGEYVNGKYFDAMD